MVIRQLDPYIFWKRWAKSRPGNAARNPARYGQPIFRGRPRLARTHADSTDTIVSMRLAVDADGTHRIWFEYEIK